MLEGPKGRIYLFATYPGIKWCRVPLIGKVPCGFPQRRKEKTLASFSSFRKEDVLLSEQASVTCAR